MKSKKTESKKEQSMDKKKGMKEVKVEKKETRPFIFH